jgi:hypothetical protein
VPRWMWRHADVSGPHGCAWDRWSGPESTEGPSRLVVFSLQPYGMDCEPDCSGLTFQRLALFLGPPEQGGHGVTSYGLSSSGQTIQSIPISNRNRPMSIEHAHVVRWPCPKCYSPRTIKTAIEDDSTKITVRCQDCGHVWDVNHSSAAPMGLARLGRMEEVAHRVESWRTVTSITPTKPCDVRDGLARSP